MSEDFVSGKDKFDNKRQNEMHMGKSKFGHYNFFGEKQSLSSDHSFLILTCWSVESRWKKQHSMVLLHLFHISGDHALK